MTQRRSPVFLALGLCAAVLLLPQPVRAAQAAAGEAEAAEPAPVQDTAAAGATDPATLEAQLAQALQLLQSQQQMLEEQRRLLSEQNQRIDRLQAEIDDIRSPVSELPKKLPQEIETPETIAQTTQAPAGPSDAGSEAQTAVAAAETAVEDSVDAAEETEPSTAEAVDVGAAESPKQRKVAITEEAQGAQEDDPTRDLLTSLPGAVRLPGTNAVMRIAGFVKTGYVQSFDPLSIDDKFVTGSIPVSQEQKAGVEAQNVITVDQSRLSIDLREPTNVGLVRAFVEGDFAGSGNTFRLRHAFGQRGNVLAGKTWSVFVDRTASPEEIDFEGLNARVNLRQAQVRVQPGIGRKYELLVSLEDPDTQVTNGSGVSRTPDMIAAGRVNWGDRVHARIALLLRQVRAKWDGQIDATEKKWGYGTSISGRVDIPWLDSRDNLLFQLNAGRGIGHYVNDLNSVGDFDGIFSDTGELKLIDVLSGYVALQHWWASTMRSTAILGYVHLDNPDFVADDFYKNTWRASVNLMWSPTPRVEVGAELLWGRRENENGSEGEASQMQLAAKYLF